MVYILWFSVFFIMTTYFIYPIAITFIGNFSNKRKLNKNNTREKFNVTIIISAYNEEKVIEKKVLNTLQLDYPDLEILIVSDGSTDNTNKILERYENYGIKILKIFPNVGKTEAQNQAIKVATGDIIVFSDSNSMYDKNAIKELVKHFYDDSVDLVSGELNYINKEKDTTNHENLYWKYEKYIKNQESKLGLLLGANGAIYAVRKEAYVKLPYDIISDFIEPLMIIKKRKKVIYEPNAKAYEETSSNVVVEFNRKKRIITRSIYGMFYAKSLLNPLKYPIVSFMLIGHKILRWLVPWFLLGIFTSNLFLLNNHFIYIILLIAQLTFYTLAFIGHYFHNIKTKIITIPTYFFIINFAAFLGTVDYILGKKIISWKPIR